MARARRSREEWKRLVREWESSSERAREFCARHDLKLSTFQWWRWRLGSAAGPPAEISEGWVELSPARPAPVDDTSSSADLTLVLGDGISIRIPVGFDGPTLERLIRTLGVIEC